MSEQGNMTGWRSISMMRLNGASCLVSWAWYCSGGSTLVVWPCDQATQCMLTNLMGLFLSQKFSSLSKVFTHSFNESFNGSVVFPWSRSKQASNYVAYFAAEARRWLEIIWLVGRLSQCHNMIPFDKKTQNRRTHIMTPPSVLWSANTQTYILT